MEKRTRKGTILLFFLSLLLSCEKKECPLNTEIHGDFRIIAVGHRIFMEDAESYESYRRSFERDVEKVSACIEPERTLLVFPEDSGLIAGLIGERVKSARDPSLDTFTAFTRIIAGYSEQMAYIQRAFPQVATNIGRVLTLALTHVVWRAFYETFSSIAKKYRVYVISSVNVALSEKNSEPEVVSIFGDPEDEYVYFPSSPEVYNSAVLFSPEGEVLARVNKCYLVPEERDLLAMTHEDVRNLKAVELPFGKVGVVTSKDAWMVDVVDRLHILGARVLLQPEAFSGWTYDEYGGWRADKFMESSWANVQKYPLFLYSVVPMLVGNFFSMSFDGQTHIVKKSEPDEPLQGFVGSVLTTGFSVVQPWVMDDPIVSNPNISLAERRGILHEREMAMSPGSGSPYENEYREYSALVEVVMKHPEPIKPTPSEVTPTVVFRGEGFQRFPDVAVSPDGTVYVVWSEIIGENEKIFITKKKGGEFSTPVQVSPEGYHSTFPSVEVLSSGRVVVSWEGKEASRKDRDVYLSFSDDGMTFPFTSPVDNEFVEYDQWVPQICAEGDVLHVVWVDFRLGSEDTFYDAGSNGENFGTDIHVDSTSQSRADQQDNSYRPTIACKSGFTPIAVWSDFRNYSWDIYGSIFPYGNDFILNDSDTKWERLDTDPQAVVLEDGSYFVVWTDIRGVPPWPSIWGTVVSKNASVSENVNISGEDNPAWFPAVRVSPSGKIAVAWQALSGGENHIFVSTSDDGRFFSAPVQISVAGGAYTPRIRFKGDTLIVVWQGIENGKGVIYYVEINL